MTFWGLRLQRKLGCKKKKNRKSILQYPGGANIITWVFTRVIQRKMWHGKKAQRDATLLLWRWRKGYGPRNTGGLWQLGKARKPILPYASSKECSLVIPRLQPSETFNLQTIRYILVKQLNLWSCIITAVIINESSSDHQCLLKPPDKMQLSNSVTGLGW